MKCRGGNYNIGISVCFQPMFIDYKVFTRDNVAWRNFKKIHDEIGLQQHLISSEDACL